MPDIALTPVASSQIDAIGHDPETNTLAIRFPVNRFGEKAVYHYSNFTAEDFAAFQAADSKGSYFGQHIKNDKARYPFRKILAAPPPELDDNPF
jgi:hypothetical protein